MGYSWTDTQTKYVDVKEEEKKARIEKVVIPSSAETNKWYDFAVSVHVDSGTFKPACGVCNSRDSPGNIKIKTQDGKVHDLSPGLTLISVSSSELSPCNSFGILGAKILFTKPGKYKILIFAGYPT